MENNINQISKIKPDIIELKENKSKIIEIKPDYSLIRDDINIKKYLKFSPNYYDYDEIIEEDKRTFCQYYCEKIKYNQMIINTFFIIDLVKPKPIKIVSLIVTIDIYFLSNCFFIVIHI